ncbi:1914_t:CDS:2 [Diversispora eburnea]|uniref:Gluconokinase n=1 Tax=Diversispora eburnea TaxID=1213867 RepID=A0A9N8VAP4_9GLOM|nr:1914_t:CDS:2 [Diversispora eburnea]
MGVSGSGKSTIGNIISLEKGMPFIEGDNLHPLSNIEKMTAGIPLNDSDRKPWLQSIKESLKQVISFPSTNQVGGGILVTCSALKLEYRNYLRKLSLDEECNVSIKVWFIYLKGSRELIEKRLIQRQDHFMKVNLLKSQFEALEEPNEELEDEIIIVEIDDKDLNKVKNEIIDKIKLVIK